MNPIVIGMDGSEESLRAGRLGAELARGAEAAVVLAHSHSTVPVAPEVTFATAEWIEIARQEGERILLDAADRLHLPDAERVLLHGTPAEALARLAADRKASMIVVGSRGLGAVKRLLLGSVADRLAHIASCPVLIVR